MSCGCESLLTNVTRAPRDTVMSRGDTPFAVMVMVVVLVEPPPPPPLPPLPPLLPLFDGDDGESPPHAIARHAAASAAAAYDLVLTMVRALRRTFSRC
jgi:hypothetical protein